MSELRSVLVFFFGLLFFVLLVAFALGRITLPTTFSNPFKNFGKKITPTVTPAVTATPTMGSQPTNVVVVATQPPVANTVQGVSTIPETGSPTLLLTIPFLASGAGFWLKKRE